MRSLLLITLGCVLQSCASILGVEEYAYRVESQPLGLPYSITDRGGINVVTGVTPDTIRLPSGQRYFRKQEYRISVDGPDGNNVEVRSEYDTNGWYAANLLFGGVIGMLIVDPLSGAMYKPKDFIIDTVFSNNSIKSVTITISENGGDPITKEDRKRIRAYDDVYLGHD